MATETTSNDNNTAAQTTSSSARPKVKIFDASAMAQTFVSVPKTKISKSVPTKALLSKPPPVAHNAKPKPKAKRGGNRKATQTTPLFDEIGEDDWVSFDGEFQDVKYPGKPFKPELAWVAVTGPNGEVLYNVFSRYEDEDPEGTYRQLPRGFGVTWNDLKYRNGAINAREVEKNLKKFFEGRTVVVHAGRQDKLAFNYEKAFEAAAVVIDTQKLFAHLQLDGQPKLSLAAKLILDKDIQRGDHSPVEDAQTAGELFKKHLENKKKAAGAKETHEDKMKSKI